MYARGDGEGPITSLTGRPQLASFAYNVAGHRVSAVYDAQALADPSLANGFDDDVIEYYAYDHLWRLRYVWRQDAVPPKESRSRTFTGSGTRGEPPAAQRPAPYLYERYVYHHAGLSDDYALGERVAVRYRNAVRDSADLASKDPAVEQSLEEETYFLHNARGDVMGVVFVDPITQQQRVVRFAYSAFGVPFVQADRLVGDHTGDGTVAIDDYFGFLTDFLADPPSPCADIDGDGEVTIADYFTFLTAFFEELNTSQEVIHSGWAEAGGVLGGGARCAWAGGGVDETPMFHIGAAGQLDVRFLYGGYWYDKHLGLYHVRHRVYHPHLGRWLQPDPLGYIDGWNLYAYVGSSPMSMVDLWGLFSIGGFIDALIDGASHGVGVLTGRVGRDDQEWNNTIEENRGRINQKIGEARDAGHITPQEAGTLVSAAGEDAINVTNQLVQIRHESIDAIEDTMWDVAASLPIAAAVFSAHTLITNPTQFWAVFDLIPGGRAARRAAGAVDAAGDAARSGSRAAEKPIYVIGRQADTAVAKDWAGHSVLDIPDWTIAKNDAWIKKHN